jgi:hypothetical protein
MRKKVEKYNISAYIRDSAAIFGSIPIFSMSMKPTKLSLPDNFIIFIFISGFSGGKGGNIEYIGVRT